MYMINNRKEDKGDHYTEVNSSLLYKPLFQVTPSQNPLIHPTAVHMPILNTDEIIKTKQEINVLIDRLSGHKVPKKKESKTSTDLWGLLASRCSECFSCSGFIGWS